MKATARVQCRRPEASMTEVEVCMATYLWFVHVRTLNCRLLTTVYIMDGGWGASSSKGYAWTALENTWDSAADLGMKCIYN